MAQMNAQERALNVALSKLDPAIREAFLNAVQRARRSINMQILVAHIEAGRLEDAVQLLRVNQALFGPLDEAIRSGFLVGGNLAGDVLPVASRAVYAFSGRHHRAESYIRSHAANLIQGLEDEAIEAARNVVLDAVQRGQGATKTARELVGRQIGKTRTGGFLGLNAQQTDSIISGRAKLLSGDPDLMREYLRLKLRNRRYDSKIRKTIKDGGTMSVSDVDAIIHAHKQKALLYRGKVIAKQEAQTAIAKGRHEGMLQMIEGGQVEDVTVRWQHNFGNEPRIDHVAMNGTVISIKEKFVFPDGTQMDHPKDPNAPAEHTIGCKCIGFYRPVFPVA